MTKNLTKKEIVLQIHEQLETSEIPQKGIFDVVQLTLDTIGEALKNGRNVELRNFGVFKIQRRKSRIGRNPNRPETNVIIPERVVIKFIAGKSLKEKMKIFDTEAIEQIS